MKIIKKILRNIFIFFKKKILLKFLKNKNFNTEIRIADAITYLENEKKIKSIMFWTTHKCASTFVSKFLSAISEEAKLKHFDYAGSIWELGDEIKIKNPYEIAVKSDFLYRMYGEIYGPIRNPIDLNHSEQLNNIFFLRDPRDLIISQYYSTVYSHPLPSHKNDKKIFTKKRHQIKKMGINKYFLEQIDKWIIPQYTKYRLIKKNSKLSFFHKYEDLKINPRKTILEITKNMNTHISKKLLNNLVKRFEKPFQKKSEMKLKNKFLHTRSGESRQFESEINKDVLKLGNRKLVKILNFWNFQV